MADIVKRSTNILRIVSGAALCCTLAGCSGALVYRPEKKSKPVMTAAAVTHSDLPPVPDIKANKATLAGIDTTGIGIRDDVHVGIYTNYTSAKKRTILMEIAKTLQAVIVKTPKRAEEAKKLEQSFNDAIFRLKVLPGLKPGEADEMDRFLYSQSVNTPQRLKAYLQYNLLLGVGKGGPR